MQPRREAALLTHRHLPHRILSLGRITLRPTIQLTLVCKKGVVVPNFRHVMRKNHLDTERGRLEHS